MQTLVEDVLYLVVNCRIVRLDLIVGRDTYGLAVSTEGEGVDSSSLEVGHERCLDILRLYLLLKHYNVVATTGEVDALAQATDGEAANHKYDDGGKDTERYLAV